MFHSLMFSGFWLRTQKFYEQPNIHFTYEYLLVAESDDPSYSIVCNSMKGLVGSNLRNEEHCTEFQVKIYLSISKLLI